MSNRQASCEERLPEHLEGRLEDMRSMTGWLDAWSKTNNSLRYDAAERRVSDYPLWVGIERKFKLKLELSTGGPADFITAEIEDGRLEDVEYHFQDWFDGASRTLTGDDLATVEDYVRRLVDLDSPQMYVEGGAE